MSEQQESKAVINVIEGSSATRRGSPSGSIRRIKNIALSASSLAASGKRTEETEKLYSIERETIRELIPEDDERASPLDFWFLDRVEMEHLVWAIRREYQKSGKLIEPESFGKYRRLLNI